MKSEDLSLAFNELSHALRYTEAGAKRFVLDRKTLAFGSTTAASIAFIYNRLAEAQSCLSQAKAEIAKLIEQDQGR
jgi:hypothetical protein